MRENWQTRVKKLALAYGTGWEYIPESEEAGSVLIDIFLEMEERNRERYEKIWQKQELAFLQAVPEDGGKPGELQGALLVKASGGGHGRWVEEGSEAYALSEKGNQTCFCTTRPLQLTAARLQYAVCRRGLSAWLSYEAGEEDEDTPVSFRAEGEALAHPVFRWYFQGLCNGKADVCFGVDFRKPGRPSVPLPGKWAVGDGERLFPLDWRETEKGFLLEGRTPEFMGNLEGGRYEVRLEIPPEEELSEEWMRMLCGGFTLTEAPEERKPELCITDAGAKGEGRLFPFGNAPEEAACCYFSCDRLMAEPGNELCIRFRESFFMEERLPREEDVKAARRYYKKYPWLEPVEKVQDWQVEDTLWEYFNGKLWRALPGSSAWKTACSREAAGEKRHRWKRPDDMAPCVVEGEEHFYIRLRLLRVRNAYSLYYRKAVPVMEEIYFSAGERRFLPAGQEVPGLREAGVLKKYLGFDREVTPDNCWYAGEWCSPCDDGTVLGAEPASDCGTGPGAEPASACGSDSGVEPASACGADSEAEPASVCGAGPGAELRFAWEMAFGKKPVQGFRLHTVAEDGSGMILGREIWFGRETLLGRQSLFGKEAFWVELDGDSWENPVSLLPNFVPIRQQMGEADVEESGNAPAGGQISGGTPFSLESREAGALEAVCLWDIRRDRAGAPVLSGRQAAEHYFAHFGRLLTPMDIELMIQERYPLLRVRSCTFRRDRAELAVVLTYGKHPGSRAALMLTESSLEELQSRRPELGQWLEELISCRGPLWLRGCRVSLTVSDRAALGQVGDRKDTGNAGTDIAG